MLDLKQIYEEIGPGIAEGNGGNRASNLTKEESPRVCHVIADSRNATLISKVYQRITNRAELDSHRHDLFAEEFRMLFNDPSFNPDLPEASHDVMLDYCIAQCSIKLLRHLRQADIKTELDKAALDIQ